MTKYNKHPKIDTRLCLAYMLLCLTASHPAMVMLDSTGSLVTTCIYMDRSIIGRIRTASSCRNTNKICILNIIPSTLAA